NSVRVQATHSSRDRIDVEVGASTVSVKAESRRGIAQMVEYQISAPAWMNLNLHGVSTDIEVDGAQGAVTAETVNGEVKCRGGSGQVSLKSVQGAVRLQNAKGHVDVYSVSEGLTLENVSGDISAETVSGDISLEGIESASVEVSTVSGDVTYEGSIKDGAHYPLAALALLAGAVPPARAQGEFHWSGRLASGKRLEIKGVNGDIHAVGVTSGEATVTARKHARRSDPESVEIKVVATDDAVTICA